MPRASKRYDSSDRDRDRNRYGPTADDDGLDAYGPLDNLGGGLDGAAFEAGGDDYGPGGYSPGGYGAADDLAGLGGGLGGGGLDSLAGLADDPGQLAELIALVVRTDPQQVQQALDAYYSEQADAGSSRRRRGRDD